MTNTEITHLHKASENGHESIMQLLLSEGSNFTSYNMNRKKCSTFNQKKDHEIIVQLLISKEADIHSCDQYKETHLHKATKN